MSESDDVYLACPFWIDTDGYSSRDRDMFVAGFEYGLVYCNLVTRNACTLQIGMENFDRTRMLLSACKRKYRIVQMAVDYVKIEVDAAR